MKSIDQFEAEAPILQKSVDLYKELYEHTKTFPKKDQYLLGKRCEEAVLDFLECILFAASSSREPKLQALQKANAKFDLLKVLLRIARELKMERGLVVVHVQVRDVVLVVPRAHMVAGFPPYPPEIESGRHARSRLFLLN